MIMTGSLFKSEAEFEKALINTLKNKGGCFLSADRKGLNRELEKDYF